LSTRDFFWFGPNALLARYFAGHQVFAECYFVAMSLTQSEYLFAAYLCSQKLEPGAWLHQLLGVRTWDTSVVLDREIKRE
jgi:hypothetical protein